MFTELRTDYERYKAKAFAEQLLRLLNTMFAVFAYWNLVRDSVVSKNQLSPAVAALIATSIVSGLVFGILLLLRFERGVHVIILPCAIVGFLCSAWPDPLRQTGLVLGLACSILVVVRFVIATANRINRL